MTVATDYARTVALYCGDLLEELREFPELEGENRIMEAACARALEEDPVAHLAELTEANRGYLKAVLALLARTPRSSYLGKLLKRVESLLALCEAAGE